MAAIEAVPLADRGLPPSTYDLLRRAATRWPDQPAISVLPSAQAWDDPVNLTYAELLTRVHRLANVLHRVGVRRGDPVAVLCPNTSDVLAGSLAAQVVGVAAPVNPGLAADRVRGLIAAAGSRVLLAAGPELDPQVWDTVLQVAADSGLETVLVVRPDAAPADAPVGAPPLPEVGARSLRCPPCGAAAWDDNVRMDRSIDGDLNQLVARAEEAADAWVRGDVGRYLDLVHHARGFTLLAPTGGPASRHENRAGEFEGWVSYFADGEATCEHVMTHAWGDTVVLIMTERQHGRIGDQPDQNLSVRVTHVYRRADGDWQLVHRHADPLVSAMPPDELHALLRR